MGLNPEPLIIQLDALHIKACLSCASNYYQFHALACITAFVKLVQLAPLNNTVQTFVQNFILVTRHEFN